MRPRFWMLAIAGILLSSATYGDDRRPNVVLIVADDLGGVDLGCYGSTFYKTPNLDRLAREGKRFTEAYAACPVCSPTRAALMTGKVPARLHLTDWLPGKADAPGLPLRRPEFRQALPLEELTVAESLKLFNYATAIVGKWHLGGDGFEPTKQGFDVNIGGDNTGTALSYWAPFERNGRKMPGLESSTPGEYLTDRLTTEAVKFINAHKAEPFFLYFPHYAVHTPMTAKEDLIAHYPAWDGTPHGRQENPTYAAMIESLDESVGRVMSALDSAGIAEQTLLIFTSDNGGLATREGPRTPATNNSPFREGKGWLYEGGVRVPLMVRWPGKIAPGTTSVPAWSPDLPVTIKAICGVDDGVAVDGVSLAGLLRNDEPIAPRALHWHYPHYSNQGGRPGAAIREGDWKLIVHDENGRRELFNIARDKSESRNLAEQMPDRAADLASKLAAWRKAVDAQLPAPNPNYVPNPQGPRGGITLHARTAEVHGAMLRFEPLPHKDTLGFWVQADDWASWEFTVTHPGRFDVSALMGCGKGSGGSTVTFQVAGQTLTLKVPETGGFQKFERQDLGTVAIDKAGRYRLEVRVANKPGMAVMDLRQVVLAPVK